MSKALTMPENSSILEVCKRMVGRRADAALLIDSNAFLCGILTDKDIATRVIAQELNLEETLVSKVMTRNPVFVLSDTLAVEALQKMLQGKFRHLPVVENGEVIALLDIAKCLYDAIARMERFSEKGKAIAAAVEGVEKQWRTSIPSPNRFLESLRERMFRPCLSTILSDCPKIVLVLPTDSVLSATKRMLEFEASSAVVSLGKKPMGILTSSDILMRVIAKNLSPDSTSVEQVMTANPECGTVDTPILDALHTLHNGQFLHLPIVDSEKNVVAVTDVIHVTRAAIATVESCGALGSETTTSMMQNFWDSAMAVGPSDEGEESRSEASMKFASEADNSASALPFIGTPTSFSFKLEDRKGRMHRFNCDAQSMTELITCILQRASDDIDKNLLPQILYEDEDFDKVVLSCDSDLAAAVEHAKLAGWKSLKLYLDFSGSDESDGGGKGKGGGSRAVDQANREAWLAAYKAVAAGAALVAGLTVVTYLKRTGGSS
ncbi:CBS domain-containing protein CBSCBSPB5 [Apostasia shenzhenica]|uniref:CBS domain-containing protein CBSCBSPB5 n=1 Tax=Apostasia shenzhenica TaxID=1088818 RepID=A0A2I0AN10_9ASPA|nr:CBS domain-containing protein CBSCBSPB5 [Apostasia shenzhenica]